jgi:hypothetical protein
LGATGTPSPTPPRERFREKIPDQTGTGWPVFGLGPCEGCRSWVLIQRAGGVALSRCFRGSRNGTPHGRIGFGQENRLVLPPQGLNVLYPSIQVFGCQWNRPRHDGPGESETRQDRSGSYGPGSQPGHRREGQEGDGVQTRRKSGCGRGRRHAGADGKSSRPDGTCGQDRSGGLQRRSLYGRPALNGVGTGGRLGAFPSSLTSPVAHRLAYRLVHPVLG